MKLLIVSLMAVALVPAASAQSATKADISANAEYRVRYLYENNVSGNEQEIPGQQSAFVHRLKLDGNFRASEKISGKVTVLHNAVWGGEANLNSELGAPDAASTSNLFLVNQAYGNWMLADDMRLRIGRQNFSFGDGRLMGINDWEATPYAFDGVSGAYDMEVGSLKAWAFKVAELTSATTGAGGDPEHNSYGVSFDFKTKPEMLKMVNLHAIKDVRATSFEPGTPLDPVNGRDFMRYGVQVAGEWMGFDFGADYQSRTGEWKSQATPGAAVDKIDGAASMTQVHLGYGVEYFMNSRMTALWHKDSGDAANADSPKNFDGYFHEKHNSAGMMDLLGWGNLTYWGLKLELQPLDGTTVGAAYYRFSRTETGPAVAGVAGVTPGLNGASLFGEGAFDNQWSLIGSELDLYAEHKYDGNLSTFAYVGMFSPADYLKKATPEKGDPVLQIFVQAQMTF